MITKVDVNGLEPDELIIVEDYENATIWYGQFLRIEGDNIILYDFDVRDEMDASIESNVYRWESDNAN